MPQQGALATFDAADTGDQIIRPAQAGLTLHGYSIKETAGAVATAVIRNGTTTSGAIVAHISLAANGIEKMWFGDLGIKCPDGIFVDRLTGTTEVVVFSHPG